MLSSIGFLVASLTVLAVVSVAQTAGDSATGSLQVAKERFTLKHSFAVMEADPFSNGEKENVVVVLTDAPIPHEMRKASGDWRLWLSEQAASGAIHGLVLTINPETKIWDAGHLLTKGGFMFYTESISGDVARNLNFAPSGAIGDHIAGKVSMKEPMHGMSDDDGPWQVDAQFSSSVVKRAAVTGTLTGADAVNSPQNKAVRAFLEACRKKDLTAISAVINPKDREDMMKMFSGPQKDEMLEGFAQMAESTLAYTLTKVTIRGEEAELEFKDPKPDAGSSTTLRVVLVGGEWKMAR